MSRAIFEFPMRPSRRGEPTWELLDQFPTQGKWTIEEYALLPSQGRLVEYNEGVLEVLSMPDWLHQRLAFLICAVLERIKIGRKKGVASLPPFNLVTTSMRYRHPDVMYLSPKNLHRFKTARWDYADLVIEIVNADDPARDYVEKRVEYAQAGIPEYWIVDPVKQMVMVLSLEKGIYREASVQPIQSVVTSVTLPEIQVDMGDLFAQASAIPTGE